MQVVRLASLGLRATVILGAATIGVILLSADSNIGGRATPVTPDWSADSQLQVGDVPAGAGRSLVWVLRNHSDRDITISTVRSECTCVKIDMYPSRVGPYSEARIAIAIAPGSAGAFHARLVVLGEHCVPPELECLVEGRYTAPCGLLEDRVSLGDVYAGSQTREDCRCDWSSSGAPERVELTSSSGTQHPVHLTAHGIALDFHVPREPNGYFREELRVTCFWPTTAETCTLFLQGRIVADARARRASWLDLEGRRQVRIKVTTRPSLGRLRAVVLTSSSGLKVPDLGAERLGDSSLLVHADGLLEDPAQAECVLASTSLRVPIESTAPSAGSAAASTAQGVSR